MSMHKNGFYVPDESDEQFLVDSPKDAKVFTVPFSPLEQRIKNEQPDLFPALSSLKEKIGEDAFLKHFSTIQSIKRNETTVMLITSTAMQRTTIEANYLPAIQAAFNVEYVRTVCL
ncbi:DnaA N-terminal domain-containing protein [Succinispira mobilis]|uniref:DnaA N-terminal domain-containing protein n=1 Tax=Succinispira mobilis TaxID=78120 RepID=UPI00036F9000|nr:DnaA N-terminal domain-containing protein [Succinispira mobilis]